MQSIFQLLSAFGDLAPWAAFTALALAAAGTMWVARLEPTRSKHNKERSRFPKNGEIPERKIPFTRIKWKVKRIPGTKINYSDLIPLTADEVIERIKSGESLGATVGVDKRGAVTIEGGAKSGAKKGGAAKAKKKGEKAELETTPQYFVPEDVRMEVERRLAERKNDLVPQERINDALEVAVARVDQDVASLKAQNKPYSDLKWEANDTKDFVAANTERLTSSARYLRRSASRLEELAQRDPRVQAVDREYAKRSEKLALNGFSAKNAVDRRLREQRDNRAATGEGAVASESAERAGKGRTFRDRTKDFLGGLRPGGKSNRPGS